MSSHKYGCRYGKHDVKQIYLTYQYVTVCLYFTTQHDDNHTYLQAYYSMFVTTSGPPSSEAVTARTGASVASWAAARMFPMPPQHTTSNTLDY